METLKEYYQNLYKVNNDLELGEAQVKEKKVGQYLERSKVLRMEAEDAINLEKDITIEEIKRTIKNIKMGKGPGPDGYTSLYYKIL